MFTGIVEELGAVRSLEEGRLVVGCPLVVTDSTLGASVAVNGTCLTVVERAGDTLGFDLSGETLDGSTWSGR
jgi:riboflavin synthase